MSDGHVGYAINPHFGEHHEDHRRRHPHRPSTTLSAMLADMIGNMLDDGEATEGLYVLALEVRDHLEAATAAN